MSYDRALTVFSPDGRLFQIDYAMEAVAKGTCAVGVRGSGCIVLAAERRSVKSLQTPHTVHKLLAVDDHIMAAFAGLAADARVLVNKARVEAQSHRLTVEDAASVEYIARYIAGVQQRYTQRGGARPFGVSMLLGGVDSGKVRLWMTDPAGVYTEWKAAAVGRSAKNVQTFLEKQWKQGLDKEEAVKLSVRALLEVVQMGASYLEVVVLEPSEERAGHATVTRLPADDVARLVQMVEQEKAQEAERKKQQAGMTSDSA